VHVELSIERSDLETIFLDRCFDSVVRDLVFAPVNVQNVAAMLPFLSVF